MAKILEDGDTVVARDEMRGHRLYVGACGIATVYTWAGTAKTAGPVDEIADQLPPLVGARLRTLHEAARQHRRVQEIAGEVVR